MGWENIYFITHGIIWNDENRPLIHSWQVNVLEILVFTSSLIKLYEYYPGALDKLFWFIAAWL